jgi:hypothetical protein
VADTTPLPEALQSLTVASSGFLALDNLSVTAVLIPPALWLFGSALAVLGWIRRKQFLLIVAANIT